MLMDHNIMMEYKNLSKKLDLASILVSQLNRNIEARHDAVPKMSDLAEGGTIEQIAENILFVYYEYKHKYDMSELGPDVNQVVVAKARYGNSKIINMGFDGDKCLFHENPRIVNNPNSTDIHINENAPIEHIGKIFESVNK